MTATFEFRNDSPIPKYHQISQILEREIEEGVYRPGDLFTTEQEIQKRFKVSRSTARKAIEVLEHRGRLIRLVGKGTFVRRPTIHLGQPHLSSFTEDMKQAGRIPGSKLLNTRFEKPSKEVCKELNMNETEKVLCVERIRTADEIPILYVKHYLPLWLGLMPDSDFSNSLYTTLEESCGLFLEEAIHRVSVGIADTRIQSYLHIPEGSPLLLFSRTTFDRQGRAVVYEEGAARPDLYHYEIHLKRQ